MLQSLISGFINKLGFSPITLAKIGVERSYQGELCLEYKNSYGAEATMLRMFMHAGIIDQLDDTYVDFQSSCAIGSAEVPTLRVTFQMVTGLWIILALAVAVAFVVLGLQIMYNIHLSNMRQNRITPGPPSMDNEPDGPNPHKLASASKLDDGIAHVEAPKSAPKSDPPALDSAKEGAEGVESGAALAAAEFGVVAAGSRPVSAASFNKDVPQSPGSVSSPRQRLKPKLAPLERSGDSAIKPSGNGASEGGAEANPPVSPSLASRPLPPIRAPALPPIKAPSLPPIKAAPSLGGSASSQGNNA
eukprot:gene31621-6815_t